jgi:double-stranded uracil-DNA glycosylase
MPNSSNFRPTRAEQIAARGREVPDVIAPGLRVLFCGINPGLYSGAVGHHFARPGNRFWPVLFHAGFTDRLLDPSEEQGLLRFGCGTTNIVKYATARADELTAEELREGSAVLEDKVKRFSPAILAVLGIDAYRKAFGRTAAGAGRQAERIGESVIWVLPNPSGINANYQMEDLAHLFAELREGAKAAVRAGAI